MELIEVTAHFDKEGAAHPLHFTWGNRTYTVESTGRRWQDDAGQHVLVMIPGDRIFELIFNPIIGQWYLRQVGTGISSLA